MRGIRNNVSRLFAASRLSAANRDLWQRTFRATVFLQLLASKCESL
jgi:hypothetical protein